jgi:hypothetical protein
MKKQAEGLSPHRDAAETGSAEQGSRPPAGGAAGRAGSPRLWVGLTCLVAVGVGGSWYVGQYDGNGDHHSNAGGRLAADAVSRPMAAGPVAFTTDHYFPADHTVDGGGTPAARTASREGGDCSGVLRDKAATAVRKIGCTGYIGATYTRHDGQVLTSVTVLRLKDAAHARTAARALTARTAEVSFGLPDAAAQDATAIPPAPEAQFSRVAAVQDFVIVTSSAFRDGRQPVAADRDQLTTATRSLAYTVGSEFVWL